MNRAYELTNQFDLEGIEVSRSYLKDKTPDVEYRTSESSPHNWTTQFTNAKVPNTDHASSHRYTEIKQVQDSGSTNYADIRKAVIGLMVLAHTHLKEGSGTDHHKWSTPPKIANILHRQMHKCIEDEWNSNPIPQGHRPEILKIQKLLTSPRNERMTHRQISFHVLRKDCYCTEQRVTKQNETENRPREFHLNLLKKVRLNSSYTVEHPR